MKRMEYTAPDAKLTLWAIDCIMTTTGEGDSENAWDQDTTIRLPPVKLP